MQFLVSQNDKLYLLNGSLSSIKNPMSYIIHLIIYLAFYLIFNCSNQNNRENNLTDLTKSIFIKYCYRSLNKNKSNHSHKHNQFKWEFKDYLPSSEYKYLIDTQIQS